MRFPVSTLGGVLIFLGLLFTNADGAHKLRVVTTIPDLKALVEEVGGDLVDVDTSIGTIDYNVNALAQALR